MIDLKKIDKLNQLRNKAEMLQSKTQEAFHKWQDCYNQFVKARNEADKMEKEIFPNLQTMADLIWTKGEKQC